MDYTEIKVGNIPPPIYKVLWFVRFLKYSIEMKRQMREWRKGRRNIVFILSNPTQDMLSYSLIVPSLGDFNNIVMLNDFHQWISVLEPSLVIVGETVSDNMRGMCKDMRGWRRPPPVLNLHGEGTFSKRTEEFWCSGEGHDFEIVWGPIVKKALQKYGVKADTIFVTGCPRFDRYVTKEHMTRKEFLKALGLPKDKKVILYAPNFTIYDPTKTKYLDWPMDDYLKLRVDLLDHVLAYRKKHPEYSLVIKLHPAELDDIYTPALEREGLIDDVPLLSKRLHEEDLQIYDVLPNVDVVVQWASTLSTEAWIVKRPVISAQYFEHKTIIPPFVEGCEIVRDQKGLEAKLDEVLAGRYRLSPEKKAFQDKFLSDWYFKIDGRSTERAADVIRDLATRKKG